MRILLVWGMPLVAGNAQTTCAIEKAQNLKKIGNDAHLITPNVLRKLWRSGLFNWLLLAAYQLPLFFHLLWYSITFKPDIIHSSSALVFPSLAVSKILKIPHIVEAHGVMFEEAKMVDMPQFLIAWMKICEAISYNLSTKIIANAPGTKKDIVQKFNIVPEKIITISNGVNTDLFQPRYVMPTSLGLHEGYDYVCFVGNLLPWQGIQYLISSAPQVLRESPATKFLIVGDGMMKDTLIRMVKQLDLESNFIFTGTVSYQDVPKYINASKLCVAPFVKEKDDKMSPLKIYEYLACGKPVVTSNVRGAGDVVTENNAGLAVNPENPEALAEAIIKLLEDRELRESMGRNGRRLIVEEYSWEKIAMKVEEVYRSCLKKPALSLP
ncbi:MAG: Spore coat protein SA [Dehalococcoidia bacterium]|nr:Spore coat protein SA [Bacillota bacterium]MBT9142018.1 Spore coat protein SA [Bacillota bacterium]